MAPQQAQQPKAGAQVFGAQKVFIAEGRVLSDGYTVGIQLRTGQNPRVETLDFHLPTKRPFQMRYQIGMPAVSANKQRHADLQGDDDADDRQRRSPPLLQLVHAAGKFRRLIRKKVEPSPSFGRIKKCAPLKSRTEFLMHGMEHAAPTRSRRQMCDRLKNRSEERRVGKECRAGRWRAPDKQKESKVA